MAVFPAYAGVSRTLNPRRVRSSSLPRLRGGEPTDDTAAIKATMSSPPTRG